MDLNDLEIKGPVKIPVEKGLIFNNYTIGFMRNLIRYVTDGTIKYITDELTGKTYSIKIKEIKEENGNDDYNNGDPKGIKSD